MKRFALVTLLFALLAPQAHAIEAGLLGGLTFSKTNAEVVAPATQSAKAGITYGAYVDLPMMPLVDLELGAFVTNRKIENAVPILGTTTINSGFLMVPAMLRFTGLPLVNLGVGGYYAPVMGKGSVEVNGTKTAEFDGESDAGLLGSVQLRLPLVPLTHLLLDGRYIMGLKSGGTSDTKFRDFQLLAGVSFGL